MRSFRIERINLYLTQYVLLQQACERNSRETAAGLFEELTP
jgi:hypothetical protein